MSYGRQPEKTGPQGVAEPAGNQNFEIFNFFTKVAPTYLDPGLIFIIFVCICNHVIRSTLCGARATPCSLWLKNQFFWLPWQRQVSDQSFRHKKCAKSNSKFPSMVESNKRMNGFAFLGLTGSISNDWVKLKLQVKSSTTNLREIGTRKVGWILNHTAFILV